MDNLGAEEKPANNEAKEVVEGSSLNLKRAVSSIFSPIGRYYQFQGPGTGSEWGGDSRRGESQHYCSNYFFRVARWFSTQGGPPSSWRCSQSFRCSGGGGIYCLLWNLLVSTAEHQRLPNHKSWPKLVWRLADTWGLKTFSSVKLRKATVTVKADPRLAGNTT